MRPHLLQLFASLADRWGVGQFSLPGDEGGCALHGVTRPSEVRRYKSASLLLEYNVRRTRKKSGVDILARLVAQGARKAWAAGHLRPPQGLPAQLPTKPLSLTLEEFDAQQAHLGEEQRKHMEVSMLARCCSCCSCLVGEAQADGIVQGGNNKLCDVCGVVSMAPPLVPST